MLRPLLRLLACSGAIMLLDYWAMLNPTNTTTWPGGVWPSPSPLARGWGRSQKMLTPGAGLFQLNRPLYGETVTCAFCSATSVHAPKSQTKPLAIPSPSVHARISKLCCTMTAVKPQPKRCDVCFIQGPFWGPYSEMASQIAKALGNVPERQREEPGYNGVFAGKKKYIVKHQKITTNYKKKQTSQVNNCSTFVCIEDARIWAHWNYSSDIHLGLVSSF